MKRRDVLRIAAASLVAGRASRLCRAAGPRKLRVGFVPQPDLSGLYLAIERGYFRAANLEIEAVQAPSAMQVETQLVSGQIDVQLTGLTPHFLNAVAQGSVIRIVAPREFVSAACGNVGSLYALRKKYPNGLGDLTVLKGKMVGVGSVVGFTEYAVDLQLEKAGLPDGAVEYVHLPFGQGQIALLNGRVDALAVLPESARALGPIMKDMVAGPSLAAMYPGIQHSFVYYGQTLLKDDRQAGAAFLAAYLDGNRDFRGGAIPQFLHDLAARSGEDFATLAAACHDNLAVDAHIDRANLKRFIEWAVRRKYALRPMEVSELVDEGFAGRPGPG